MSFGKDSSIGFVTNSDGKLIDILRFDDNADKRSLDNVEEQVFCIFHIHEKLVEALRKYGVHQRACPYYHPILPTTEIKCTCGLHKALKDAEKLT